jgi:hypothetical protein
MNLTQKQARMIAIPMILVMLFGIVRYGTAPSLRATPTAPITHAAVVDQPMYLTKQYAASLDVARVFGRTQGCADAAPKMINDIAAEAVKDNIDARVFAALIATESSCDPMAVSSRGAVGLMQVNIKVWKTRFDFTTVNLLNPAENLSTGGKILSDMIKQYGISGGLHHFNGMGSDCAGCDPGYSERIMNLAARR